MPNLKQLIGGFLLLHTPMCPQHWFKFARGIAAGHGWMPAMFLWAICGVVLSLNIGIGRQRNIPWLEHFNLLACATWAIVGVLAVLITCRRSASAIRRLGPFGPTRPRWWFEIARVCWSVTTIALVGLLTGLFVVNPARPLVAEVFTILLHILRLAFPAFLVAATIGYLVSFVRWLPRNGRAYDCVHYFYCLFGSLGLIAYAAVLLSSNPTPLITTAAIVVGVIGVVWLFFGFLSIIRRYEAWQRWWIPG